LIAVPKFPKPIENSDRAPELRSPLGLPVNQPHSSEKYLAATEGLAVPIDFAPFAWKRGSGGEIGALSTLGLSGPGV
jgi:hypothetical protein